MKKIEGFLNKYSWLLKLGIFLLFFFWAAQGIGFLNTLSEAVKESKLDDNREASEKLNAFVFELGKKAGAKGEAYGPKDYYSGLIEVAKKRREFSTTGNPLPFPASSIEVIFRAYFVNMQGSRFTHRDIEEGKEMMRSWLNQHPSYLFDSTDKMFASADESKIAPEERRKVIGWFVSLYWRGLILSVILYLVNMAQGFESDQEYWSHDIKGYLKKRKQGILSTILSGKIKFLFAVIAWPFMLLKYPANVIREIVVEAEMRRIGGLFRRFSPAERLKIKSIANGEQYASWRKEFRKDHASAFRYAFGIAVLATLAVYLLQPLQRAEAKETMRAGPSITVSHHLQTDGSTDDDVGSSVWCEGGWGIWSPPVISKRRCKAVDTDFLILMVARCIDSVPRFGCFGRWAVSALNPENTFSVGASR